MDGINNCCHKMNKQIRKIVMLSAVSAGMTLGIYMSIKKIMETIEDKRLARYYEDEIEKIFEEKEKQKEHEDLEKAVDEFNSKRLKREECPHCSKHK